MHPQEEDFDDYGPEPNMKLSHAFMVVLLLHVVAVGGLYAFNSMKASKAPKAAAAKQQSVSEDQSGTIPRQTVSGSGNQDSPDSQNQQPDPGGKEPFEKKAPLVAKTTEGAKSSLEKTVAREATQSPKAARKGLLASMRGALEKATGVTATAGGSSVAMGQDANNASPSVADASASGNVAKTYTVKSGDTITRIASSLGVTIPELEKSNGLTQASVLQVGEILKVPELTTAQTPAVADQNRKAETGIASAQSISASTNASPLAVTSPQSTEIVSEYTVVKGDNPYKIAKRFKITPDQLMKANGITDPKKIQIGQKLKIPASSKKSAKASQ
jgi:LysM repeat protein